MPGVSWDADNPTGQPGILIPANRDAEWVISHELAHTISHGIITNLPRWLAEGIAAYFGTARVNSDETFVELGSPPSSARMLLDSRPRSVADLFACQGRCGDEADYVTSWALVAFLLNEHHDRFARYVQRLNEVSPDRRAEAWREVFPDLPPARLDEALLRWIRMGKLRLSRVALRLRDFPATVRPLGAADVYAAHSLLHFIVKDDTATIRSDSRAALAIDRAQLLARLVETEVTHSITPDDARAVAAAHPDDWRAWRLAARALRGTPEGDRALGRLCALAANAVPECTRADDGRLRDSSSEASK